MSSDEPPAVVELPDDADDAASSTDEVGAVARVLFDMFEGPPTGGPVAFHRLRAREVLAAVEPLIAARVRAEAVAGERQRWERLVQAHLSPEGVGGADQAARNSVLRKVLAAGSVPVATPEPTARDERPHSRACGLRQHEHGSACAADCPTCRAGGGWHYPVATPEPDDSRIANPTPTCDHDSTTPPPVFGRTNSWCRGPVAVRLQPERVGFGTDAFEVGGSLPGQPVATPTEPPHMHNWDGPCPACASVTPAEPAAEPDLLTALQRSLDEARRPVAASPVPAEQPPTCEHGRTTKHVYGSPDESDYGLCPGLAGQPEER